MHSCHTVDYKSPIGKALSPSGEDRCTLEHPHEAAARQRALEADLLSNHESSLVV